MCRMQTFSTLQPAEHEEPLGFIGLYHGFTSCEGAATYLRRFSDFQELRVYAIQSYSTRSFGALGKCANVVKCDEIRPLKAGLLGGL
jgi:hypothetical protein